MLNKEKIQYFKEKLEEEKKKLEEQLKSVAKPNPGAKGDWEVAMPDMNVVPSDLNELADTFEELEITAAIEDNLEEQLAHINKALEKIKKGKYGICEIGEEEIEEKRLEANPAARFCIKHTKNR